MALEREKIASAIRDADGNIGIAARRLGASRRTLQNRMREYGMPRGRSGRRKRRLPYRSGSGLLGGAALLAGAVLGYQFFRRGTV